MHQSDFTCKYLIKSLNYQCEIFREEVKKTSEIKTTLEQNNCKNNQNRPLFDHLSLFSYRKTSSGRYHSLLQFIKCQILMEAFLTWNQNSSECRGYSERAKVKSELLILDWISARNMIFMWHNCLHK